ncbi:hypothetical protein ABZX51_003841 [Aspergillus tubingensis]
MRIIRAATPLPLVIFSCAGERLSRRRHSNQQINFRKGYPFSRKHPENDIDNKAVTPVESHSPLTYLIAAIGPGATGASNMEARMEPRGKDFQQSYARAK